MTMCTVKEIQEAIREDCKSQHDMDQVPIPFPSGKQRRQDRRNGKEGMRCLSQR